MPSTDTFDIPVTFQSSTSTTNDYGEDILTFTDAFTIGAQVQQYASQRAFEARQAEVSGDALFITTRRNTNTNNVNTRYRVIVEGNTYAVTGVDRVSFRRDTIRFLADIVDE